VTQAPSTTDWGSTGAGIGGLLGKYIEGKGGIGNLFGGDGMASGNELFGLQNQAMGNISAGNIMAGSTPF
jgi:hypothetical protein